MSHVRFGRDLSTKALEPGVLVIMRILLTAQVISGPLLRRSVAHEMGVDVPFVPFILLTMPVPLLLFVLVWVPWRGRLGRILLPMTLTIGLANLLAEKFLMLSWLIPPPQRDLGSLLMLVRLWFVLHFVTLIVAWQYLWRPAVICALVLSAVDWPLSLPFLNGSPLYPLFLLLFVTRTATVVMVAMGVGWLLQHQREQKVALAAANQKLTKYAATTEHLAISRERNRLARELHDTLAHSLAAVTVQLEAVQALWEVNAQSARTMLESALHQARSGLTEARRALKALRASPLEDEGLAAALGDLARSAAASANLRLDMDTLSSELELPTGQEQFLYRVAQEAMSNVVRHAHATELRVKVEQVDGHLTLTVADDGRGFDRAAVDTSAHFGLRGMQERADLAGAQLLVESRRGAGTTVRVTIPVEGVA
jgi:signal transduction histidine kinase